jgi:hypothetical protein
MRRRDKIGHGGAVAGRAGDRNERDNQHYGDDDERAEP